MTSIVSLNSIGNCAARSSVSKYVQRIEHKIYNAIPDYKIAKKKTLNALDTIGREISTPENRLILGITALMSQPFIDWHNKKVDKETRKVSVARTVAKIIAGTFTGVLIRKGCIKSIDYMSKIPKNGAKLSKLKQFFTPKIKGKVLNEASDAYKQYKNALGTIVALVVMLFTNFAIDAPLTKYLTNKFVDHANKYEKGGK